MTYQELVALIESCVDSQGKALFVAAIDAGRKNSHSLHRDVTEGELYLVRDPITGRLIAFRIAVRVIVDAFESGIRWTLRECARTDLSGNKVEKNQEWSFSETLKRGESWAQVAIRGAREELGLTIYEKDLDYHELGFLNDTKKYNSSAYEGLWSQVNEVYIVVRLNGRPWYKDREVKDGDMKIHFTWIRY